MAGPQEDWLLIEVDPNAHIYALKSSEGKFLRAVPPVEGKPAVFADADKLHDNEKWVIRPTTELVAEPEKSCRGGSAPVAAKVQNYTTHEKKF